MTIIRSTIRPILDRHPERVQLPWEACDKPKLYLPYGNGTFVRASEGSFLVRAPDDAGGFMQWAPANHPRYEDRGDNGGPKLLIEGERFNLIKQSRDPSNVAAWDLAAGNGTWTADVMAGPDGVVAADRSQVAGAGQYKNRGQTLTVWSSGYHTLSVWGRANSGTSKWVADYGVARFNIAAQTTTWTRPTYTASVGTGSYWDNNAGYGAGSTPQDMVVDLRQFENGRFASSVIRTTTAAATRSPDSLTFAPSQVPAWLLVAAAFDDVSPVFGSADTASGDSFWLLSIDGSLNGVRIRHNGTALYVEALAAGVVVASSNALTFVAHARIGEVRWDSVAGTISVNGVVGVGGIPWTWTAPTLGVRIGGVYQTPLFSYSSPTSFARASEAAFYDVRYQTSQPWVGGSAIANWKGNGVSRVTSDGWYIGERACQNLILDSENLGAATWTVTGTGVTAGGQAAPDGDTDAWRLTDNDATAYELVATTAAIAASALTYYTFSVFVLKDADVSRFPAVQLYDTVTGDTYFIVVNTQTGALNSGASGFTNVSKRADDCGAWWRIVGTVRTAAGTNLGMKLFPALNADGSATPAVAAVGSATFWGAQLETGQVASTYVRTAGAAATRVADAWDLTISASLAKQLESPEGFWFDVVPTFSDTDTLASATPVVWNIGVLSSMYRDGATGKVFKVSHTNLTGSPVAVTVTSGWNRGDRLRFLVRLVPGGPFSISVWNVTQGTGPYVATSTLTAYTFNTLSMRILNYLTDVTMGFNSVASPFYSGGAEAFARI